jgi:hypothetical protein
MKSFLLFISILLVYCTQSNSQTTSISGPIGSASFGAFVTVLTNGNYIVSDPDFNLGAITRAGAVYLYRGSDHTLISTLTGSSINDRVGITITPLSNGNFIVSSPFWNNGATLSTGAVTWGNGTTGITGVVSASNSLIGSSVNDGVGGSTIALTNGNYVVGSPNWDNGATINVGAATWGNGTTGTVGSVSASNSLIGSTANDAIGNILVPLTNGNYIASSWIWDNGATADVGAVTWGDGTLATSGTVSSSNSLVGSSLNDNIGNALIPLTNGNYVVGSQNWDNGTTVNVGAATWGNGATGTVGAVSAGNSFIGSSTNDWVGSTITTLNNGNYVLGTRNWDDGATADVGAATWCNGSSVKTGTISASNSLIGSTLNDFVGNVIALTNGNYVVSTTLWNNGATADVGAATWCDGSIGRTGTISTSNSLIGSVSGDWVGQVVPLTNGNYVVGSQYWDNGTTVNAGAATWGDGTSGSVGIVSASNSLVGSTANDNIGIKTVPLTNGNYVLGSQNWDNGTTANVGAITWGNGGTGTTGVVSASNSIIGSTANDEIGIKLNALNNGNYVGSSINWDNGATVNVGASTWGDGSMSTSAVVSASNSLIGSIANDNVSISRFLDLEDGNYTVGSGSWDNGAIVNAGAFSVSNDAQPLIGTINTCNSVLGNTANPSLILRAFENKSYKYVIVGIPMENKLTIRKYQKFNSSSFSQSICANGSYMWNGIAQTMPGAYKDTFIGSNGCDSIVTLNLTISPAKSSSFSQIICANSSYTWNGIAQTTSGAYLDTFLATNGCDSIVTLNLTVNPIKSSSFSQTICANSSYTWNGIARTTSGAYLDTFPAANGCDSIVTLNLTVNPLPSKLTTTLGMTITATQSGASYQWFNCTPLTAISGATAQAYILQPELELIK